MRLPHPLLRRLLTLLLGLLYLGGACELDREETRRNFANECHEGVLPTAAGEVAPVVAVRSRPRRAAGGPGPGRRNVWPDLAIEQARRGWPPAPAEPPPPLRRWLRCVVIQV